ncbi:MAG: hypothetical protein Q8922_03385 [Bacteroidota bacterium]|nr:hypothetical protein [Bacteroidota bacterium]MDP4233333.1 hypothetical protein [Bacteroidota bacterium]MDP4244187.1 hypothetical protein [Bacteroidota bacterium]MDP4286956.1 hypothetical protein [Bacteroidota bacterium]
MKQILHAVSVLLILLSAYGNLFAQVYAERYGTKFVLGGNAAGITPLTLLAPASGLSSYSLTLPGTVGAAGQTLVTVDGNGSLGWAPLSGTNTGDVSLAGSPNYLTIAGQVITRNAINLSNSNNITSTLPIANGGTNASTSLSGGRPMVSSSTAIVENNATLTNNRIPKWSTSSVGNFADASIADDGTTVSTNEILRLGAASSNTGSLAFANSSNANLTALQAGVATAAITYKLPTTNGSSGQVLATDGSNPAQLRWVNGLSTGSGLGGSGAMYLVRAPINTSTNTGASSNTPVNVAGMSFPIGAGDFWSFRIEVSMNCATNANGMNVGLTIPTGARIEAEAEGLVDLGASGHTVFIRISSSGQMVGPFNLEADNDAGIFIFGTVDNTNGSNGTVQLQIAAPATGDAGLKTVYRNSFLTAWQYASAFERTYTSSTTYVVPSGITTIYATGIGGAGGGGGGGGDNGGTGGGSGGGGGAGEYIPPLGLSVTPGETLTITVGIGGSGGSAGTSTGTLSTVGGNGNVTSIVGSTSGTLLVANGGTGGGRGHNSLNDATNAQGGTSGPGGTGSSTAGHTNGNAGAAGVNGAANSDKAGGAGGSGPPTATNLGGTGGTGNGHSANGTAGSSGTDGSVTLAY